jgi:hypothetical protein
MSWKGDKSNVVPNPVQSDINLSEGRVDDNRALHIRRDTDDIKNFTITIKDIDETVFGQLQKMQLTVFDSGNTIKVPVMYASPEKWKSVRKDGFMRDNNGKIIFPALVYNRVNTETDKSMQMFNKYLRYDVIKKYSQKNQYTKFNILVGKNVPTNEVYSVVMPDNMIFTYKFVIWTEYIEQMNSLLERINFETNDYWGTEKGFRFRTTVDSYAHTTEFEDGNDRIVKTEFDLLLRGYLLPDVFSPGLDGFKPTTEKRFTAKKIVMGMEVVQSDWEPIKNKIVEDKWRSQSYPNIVKGSEPPVPPVVLKDENVLDKSDILSTTPVQLLLF